MAQPPPLPDHASTEVRRLKEEGDAFLHADQPGPEHGSSSQRERALREAIRAYQEAFSLIEDPIAEGDTAAVILCHIAEAEFRGGDPDATMFLAESILGYNAPLCAPYAYLRLGQSLYETGDLTGASNELRQALKLGGEALFANEDPKYRDLIANSVPGGEA